MSISEPINGYDKLGDKAIVRIMVAILLTGLVVFVAIGIGGAAGIIPNACVGPDQRIMHARCEGPTNLTTIPGMAFYPGYIPTTRFNDTRLLNKGGYVIHANAEPSVVYRVDEAPTGK